jgi:hypothetical protein
MPLGILTRGGVAEEVVSRAAEGAVRFGWPVVRGTDPLAQVKEYPGTGDLFGIALRDERKGHGPDEDAVVLRHYNDHEGVAVMRKGPPVSMVAAQDGILPGMKLALCDVDVVVPTTTLTFVEHSTGTNPPVFSATTYLAYSVYGPWGQSLLRGKSAMLKCDALTNFLKVTVPGQTVLPVGTTFLQLWYSTDNGVTWHDLSDHKIPWGSITAAATHVEDVKTADDTIGAAHPPAAEAIYPTVGGVLLEASTYDKTVFANTEIVAGGDVGDEIEVQVNLPA